MSDFTKMNIEQINSILLSFDTTVGNFKNAYVKASEENFFKILKDAALENGFVKSYDDNNIQLISSLDTVKSTIQTIVENAIQVDTGIEEEVAALEGRSRARSGGSSQSTKEDDSTIPQTQIQLIDNSKEQLEQYANMSMSDLSLVASELGKLADANNMTLDKLLTGEDYTLKIQSALLASPNLSENLKNLIQVGDVDISQKLLLNIFSGKAPEVVGMNDDMKNVIKTYLQMVADSNHLSLETLLRGPEYSNVLKDSLRNFNNIPNYLGNLTDDNMGSALLDVYDGNNIGDMNSGEVSIIRNFIDTASASKSSNIESLLGNISSIKSDVVNLGKSSVFMNNLTKFSNEATMSILSTLMGIE